MATSNDRIVESSGNVFADPGVPDAAERQTKVRLAVAINQVLQRRGVSQGAAAKVLGIDQRWRSPTIDWKGFQWSV